MRVAAFVAIAAAAACAHSGPKDGYTGWHTVTTEHFAVHTLLSATDAEEAAFQLELVYRALAGTFFPNATFDPVEVLLFQRAHDVDAAIAEFSKREEGARGGLVLIRPGALILELRAGGSAPARGTQVAKFTTPWQMRAVRELTRRFIDGAMDRPPIWFRVGLTRYLATAQVESDGAIFGRRPDDLAWELGKGRAIPLGELLAAGRAQFEGEWRRDYEASAWGFVHYLLCGEDGKLRPRFDAIADALVRGGRHASSRAAVERAFADLPFAEFETKVRDYAVDKLGRRTTFHPLPVSVTAPPSTRGTAKPADPGRVQALLWGLRRR